MKSYGIIGGLGDNRYLQAALDVFKEKKVSFIIVNGDMCLDDLVDTSSEQKQHMEITYKLLTNTNIPTIIQPGLHDSFISFEAGLLVNKSKEGRRSNIFDSRQVGILKDYDHALIFVPGYYQDNATYTHGKGQHPKNEEITQVLGWGDLEEEKFRKLIDIDKDLSFHFNLAEYNKVITHPKSSIVICPQPRLFTQGTYYIDSYLARVEKGGVQYPAEIQRSKFKKDYNERHDVTFSHIGSLALKDFMTAHKITKSVATADTLNVQTAHNSHGGRITPARNDSTDIHYNTGLLRDGFAGIIHVDGEHMRYSNVNVFKKAENYQAYNNIIRLDKGRIN